jgi:hypothetical protein
MNHYLISQSHPLRQILSLVVKMITMAQAAATFNKANFTDINALNPFVGQLLPFNDSTRSGSTSRRRILEVAPAVVVPKVIVEVDSEEVFIVSLPSTDFFKDALVRRKHPIIPAEASYSVKTVKEILDASPGVNEWGTVSYTRREILEDSSDYLGGYSVIFPSTVTILAGQYVILGTTTYRAREDSYVDELGFSVVEVVRIPGLLQDVTITVKGVYDPVEETSVDVPTTVSCVVEERTKAYTNTRMDSEKNEDGDVTISTLHPCKVGDLAGSFVILHLLVEDDVYEAHCRRA